MIDPQTRLRHRAPHASLGRRAPRCLLLASLAAIGVFGLMPGAAPAAPAPARIHRTQDLAALLAGHRAHRRPDARGRVLATIAELRPITGERTTLPVIGTATDPRGIRWLHVMLPGRPNGASGWIAKQGTRTLTTAWHLVVDLAVRSVRVYRNARLVRTFSAVVGKPSTPTPTGGFFVEETLQMTAGEAGGPFALALSARSNALQEFDGGPGQIALHGRANLGGTLGAAESHGCVRLDTTSIDWLARRIGPGVPVTISAG